MEQTTKIHEVNAQCIQNLINIDKALASIETKGDSTLEMYKIRMTLSGTLNQIMEDNKKEEELPISVDKTKKE